MIKYLILFLAIFCAAPSLVLAQQTPELTIIDLGPLNLMGDTSKKQDPVKALDSIDNSEMKSVLKLQNQISMLTALNNWAKQVADLRSAYANTGIPFSDPIPPKDICAQVPPNTVCGAAYPEMMPEIVASVVQTTPAPVKKTSQKAKPAEPVASYEWSDISCVSNNCKAVLVDLTSGARISALQGEMVDDNIMVQKISPDGVTLNIKGKTEQLKPSRGEAKKEAKESANSNNLADVLQDVPTDAVKPVEPIVLDDGSKTTGSGPGATGLF